MKTKYPLKVGEVTFSAGVPVEVIGITDSIRTSFPNIKINPQSNQVAIRIDGLEVIVDRKQITN